MATKPRPSVLSMFDPLFNSATPPATPSRHGSPDSDKENDTAMTAFFGRQQETTHQPVLRKQLIDVGDVSIVELRHITPKRIPLAASAPGAVGSQKVPRTPFKEIHIEPKKTPISNHRRGESKHTPHLPSSLHIVFPSPSPSPSRNEYSLDTSVQNRLDKPETVPLSPSLPSVKQGELDSAPGGSLPDNSMDSHSSFDMQISVVPDVTFDLLNDRISFTDVEGDSYMTNGRVRHYGVDRSAIEDKENVSAQRDSKKFITSDMKVAEDYLIRTPVQISSQSCLPRADVGPLRIIKKAFSTSQETQDSTVESRQSERVDGMLPTKSLKVDKRTAGLSNVGFQSTIPSLRPPSSKTSSSDRILTALRPKSSESRTLKRSASVNQLPQKRTRLEENESSNMFSSKGSRRVVTRINSDEGSALRHSHNVATSSKVTLIGTSKISGSSFGTKPPSRLPAINTATGSVSGRTLSGLPTRGLALRRKPS